MRRLENFIGLLVLAALGIAVLAGIKSQDLISSYAQGHLHSGGISCGANFSQDFTYSIGWLVFSLLLIPLPHICFKLSGINNRDYRRQRLILTIIFIYSALFCIFINIALWRSTLEYIKLSPTQAIASQKAFSFNEKSYDYGNIRIIRHEDGDYYAFVFPDKRRVVCNSYKGGDSTAANIKYYQRRNGLLESSIETGNPVKGDKDETAYLIAGIMFLITLPVAVKLAGREKM